jgi:hypothetical protein
MTPDDMANDEAAAHGQEMSAWAESDDFIAEPRRWRTVRRASQELSEEGRELFTQTAEDRELLGRAMAGRPTLGSAQPAGESPMLRVRTPRNLYDRLKALATHEGRSVSAIVRDATEQYIARAS